MVAAVILAAFSKHLQILVFRHDRFPIRRNAYGSIRRWQPIGGRQSGAIGRAQSCAREAARQVAERQYEAEFPTLTRSDGELSGTSCCTLHQRSRPGDQLSLKPSLVRGTCDSCRTDSSKGRQPVRATSGCGRSEISRTAIGDAIEV